MKKNPDRRRAQRKAKAILRRAARRARRAAAGAQRPPAPGPERAAEATAGAATAGAAAAGCIFCSASAAPVRGCLGGGNWQDVEFWLCGPCADRFPVLLSRLGFAGVRRLALRGLARLSSTRPAAGDGRPAARAATEPGEAEATARRVEGVGGPAGR